MSMEAKNNAPHTKPDIVDVLHQVLAICSMAMMVEADDLAALRRQFNLEETLVPILDPTGFMRTKNKSAIARQAVEAFAAFYAKVRGLAIDEAAHLAGVMAVMCSSPSAGLTGSPQAGEPQSGKTPLIQTGPGGDYTQDYDGSTLPATASSPCSDTARRQA